MTWYRFLRLTFFAAALVSTVSSHESFALDARAVIVVAPVSEVNTETILLGDIADISGNDVDLVRGLKELELGRAPLPGNLRELTGDSILMRCRQHNIDPSCLSLQSPDRVEVKRGARTISKEKVQDMARDFIMKNMPWEHNNVRLGDIQVSKDVVLPKGNITYRIVPPENADYLGTMLLSIVFSVDGADQEKVWATADLEVLMDVVVTSKPLGRYRVITEDDVTVQEHNLASLPSNVIMDIDEVLGKRTRRTIGSKTVLSSDLVELPPLLHRGDLVTIVADSGALRITARGEAQERGRKGEVIRVKNISSRKEIYARVVASDTVAVEF